MKAYQLESDIYPGIAVVRVQANVDELERALNMSASGADLVAAISNSNSGEQFITMRREDWEKVFRPWRQEQEIKQVVEQLGTETEAYINKLPDLVI